MTRELNVRVLSWTIPTFGNIHTMPYGVFEISDGETTQQCKTRGDTLDGSFKKYGCQYVYFRRQPYKVVLGDRNLFSHLEPIKS